MGTQTTFFHVIDQRTSHKTLDVNLLDNSEWGTFKDSLRSPIHCWFPYPAGFSNKAVEHAIQKFSIIEDNLIYDPFSGTGTTNVVAKSMEINSIGIEAHPFVYFVAKTKLYWDYRLNLTLEGLRKIEIFVCKNSVSDKTIKEEFPELVYKCFSDNVLKQLYLLREAIKKTDLIEPYKNFFNLALTCILRPVANVATGWPYIAPNKKKNGKEKNVLRAFSEMVLKMYGDVEQTRNGNGRKTICKIILGDSRDTKRYINDETVDFIFTSPPYLNNYDYADRTRLETYFFGWMKNWGEITDKVRTKLIMSATTQINRGEYKTEDILSNDMKVMAPHIAKELQTKINQLTEVRETKGGKKSYDILVGGYFNDMFQVIKDCFRILKKGCYFSLILGDSAPYGIHISTDIVLGELGKAIGFSSYEIEELRQRGKKWKGNPQRHKVELRETILCLKK